MYVYKVLRKSKRRQSKKHKTDEKFQTNHFLYYCIIINSISTFIKCTRIQIIKNNNLKNTKQDGKIINNFSEY